MFKYLIDVCTIQIQYDVFFVDVQNSNVYFGYSIDIFFWPLLLIFFGRMFNSVVFVFFHIHRYGRLELNFVVHVQRFSFFFHDTDTWTWTNKNREWRIVKNDVINLKSCMQRNDGYFCSSSAIFSCVLLVNFFPMNISPIVFDTEY